MNPLVQLVFVIEALLLGLLSTFLGWFGN